MIQGIQTMQLSLRSFDYRLLDKSVGEIKEAAERVGAVTCGPIPMPTGITRYTVLRGPHIDKKSREQFEKRLYKRVLYIKKCNPAIMDHLMKLELPAGIEIKVK